MLPLGAENCIKKTAHLDFTERKLGEILPSSPDPDPGSVGGEQTVGVNQKLPLPDDG